MGEQEVSFSSERFKKSLGLQNQVRPEETQGARKAAHRERSVPWQLTVVALVILCSLRLVAVAMFVTNIFQYVHENHRLHETLSRKYNCSTMQNDIDLKEEMLRNITKNCSPGNDLLKSLKRGQDRWYKRTKMVLVSSQHTGKSVEIHWFCYGIKCYYFILDKKIWSGCKQACQDSSLSLLKIDDEDELKFLQLQVLADNYWIGLSYNKAKEEWLWIDNGQSELILNLKKYNEKGGRCMFLSRTRLENAMCTNTYPCICEKSLDKFPDCLSN